MIASALLVLAPAMQAKEHSVKQDGGGNFSTIQACADAAKPGDTCLVFAGTYEEYVTVSRSGTSGSPVIFKAQGTVTMPRFIVNANYVRIEGFTFSGLNAFLEIVDLNGSYAEILDNTFRGPYGNVSRGVDTAATTTGSRIAGNLVVGFNMSTVFNIDGDGHVIENNIIRDSADIDVFRAFGANHIFRRNTVLDIVDGPVSNHIDFIQTFGQNGRPAYNILIEENFVHNFVGQIAQLTQGCGLDPSGSNSLGSSCSNMAEVNGKITSLSSNSLTDSTKTWITGNWLTNHWAGAVVTIINGDAVGKMYLITASDNNTLTLSEIDGGTANLTTDGVDVGDSYEIRMRVGWWTFRRNVFSNTLQSSSNLPAMTYVGNTIIGASTIGLNDSIDRGRSVNTTITNNIHLFSKFNSILYSPIGITVASFLGDYNYSSVGPPDYGPKRAVCSTEYTDFSFCEAVWPGKHGINGGDPKFANIANPLGPDGIAFTLDDGLKPLPGSPLCGRGQGGGDIGAYSCDPTKVFSGGATQVLPPSSLRSTVR